VRVQTEVGFYKEQGFHFIGTTKAHGKLYLVGWHKRFNRLGPGPSFPLYSWSERVQRFTLQPEELGIAEIEIDPEEEVKERIKDKMKERYG
jgi:hypothetical protein